MAAIEDHGVIGDLRTGALVGNDGAIDYLCWPRFDSPSIFARILDDEAGVFEIVPELSEARRQQLYLPDTNILLTRFLSRDGVVEISDFMAMGEHRTPRLVRRVKSIRCAVRLRMKCAPRFDYGRDDPTVSLKDGAAIFCASGDAGGLRLSASVPLAVDGPDAVASFELKADESATFLLTSDEDDAVKADSHYPIDAFKHTADYWREWVSRISYKGRWREIVSRSALALKLLTSREHGSVLAALTFGLPEELGGERNWDYRYVWIRDSAFTVYAFLRLNLVDEARAYQKWLRGLEDPAACGQLKLMFTIDGEETPEEESLDHLDGYRGSTPVRIGNGAAGQKQLDIYGELMDAIYLSDKYADQISAEDWGFLRRMIDWLSENWETADEGIWEMRNGQQHNLHSRLMCWVAFDRALRLARKRGLPAPVDDWREQRNAIWTDIHENFWNEDLGAYVQSKNGDTLDAACLLMPLVRFISATDPRWLSTMDAVRERLMDDSLVYRYSTEHTDDGLEGSEGTFNMCSFWYVECLARAGDVAQARYVFEKMLGYANPLGLFAEETGPAGEHLGNFPQAFTHLALISAAIALDRALDGTRPTEPS